MVVDRLHSKLFEAAALDLDRRIRFHFVGQNVRPAYLKTIERQLHDLTKSDVEGELHFMGQVVDSGVEVKGRFLGLKMLLKRILRAYSAHEARVHRMMIQRLAEQHESLMRLTESQAEMNEKLRDDFKLLAETLRAELAEAVRPVPAGETATATASECGPIPRDSKLILGPVAVKCKGYVHIDPTADGSPALDHLPVEPSTLAEVVVANVLELHPVDEVRDRLLPYWASLLQPGGKLTVIADDMGAAGDRFRDGQIDFGELAEVLFGDGPQARRSAYTPELLWQYVEDAGLIGLTVTSRKHRPEALAYGFELAAFRDAA